MGFQYVPPSNKYTLPIASATVLGGIKVGEGLAITSGVLSVTASGSTDIEWDSILNKPSVFNPSTHVHSYNDLTNKPTIPTVTNDLTAALKTNYDSAVTHSKATHAPTTAQKNSDITKAEIEAKLTGNITSHSHTDALGTVNVTDTTLTLTTSKYQTTTIVDGTTILLPSVNSFTKIHLYLTSTADMGLTLPTVKWESTPTFTANKVYELIFTYVSATIGWIGECVTFA